MADDVHSNVGNAVSVGKVHFSLVIGHFWPNPKPEFGFGSALSPSVL